jgi:hypothetical protein
MTSRRDMLIGIGSGAALLAIPGDSDLAEAVSDTPADRVREVAQITKLRIGSFSARASAQSDDESHYWAEAIEEDGKHYYRAKGVTVETTEDRYRKVIQNPYLYYFSSALWLHLQIQGELKKRDENAWAEEKN